MVHQSQVTGIKNSLSWFSVGVPQKSGKRKDSFQGGTGSLETVVFLASHPFPLPSEESLSEPLAVLPGRLVSIK